MRTAPKVGRNDPCPCGSSKKFKKCHGSGNGNVGELRPISRPSNDREGIIAAIENGVSSIRSDVAKYATADVVGWCKWPLAGIGEQFGNKLVSQYRQLAFLLSLMIETPEPKDPPQLTPQIWSRFCQHLNWLFLQYGALDADRAPSAEMQWQQSWVSKSTYLHYFNTGALATDVQLLRWLDGALVPFDAELKELCGLGASDAVAIYRAITRDIQDRDDDQYMIRLAKFAKFNGATGAISSAKYAFISSDLSSVVGSDALDAFWKHFVIRRGEILPMTKYPTDPHNLEQKPFIEVEDGVALFTVPGAGLEAIASLLTSALDGSSSKKKFLKRRDSYLESEVVRVFSSFFRGTGAQLFPDAHLDQFQHDLLVVDGGTFLIIEAKAGAMKEPFRDIDKAFVRLKHNFDSVVGEAHKQASRTRTRLLRREKLSFVTSKGEPLVEIDGQSVSEVLTVCVTADDFGPLARDMTALLDKSDTEIYPWAAMLNDVETFLAAFRRLGIAHSEFYKFLRERTTLHGRVEFGDELELAGYFFKHRTLRSLDQGPRTRTLVDARYSDIFDQLFFEDAEDL
jgi:hypothetical protein